MVLVETDPCNDETPKESAPRGATPATKTSNKHLNMLALQCQWVERRRGGDDYAMMNTSQQGKRAGKGSDKRRKNVVKDLC